jgi:hypothetical protein
VFRKYRCHPVGGEIIEDGSKNASIYGGKKKILIWVNLFIKNAHFGNAY